MVPCFNENSPRAGGYTSDSPKLSPGSRHGRKCCTKSSSRSFKRVAGVIKEKTPPCQHCTTSTWAVDAGLRAQRRQRNKRQARWGVLTASPRMSSRTWSFSLRGHRVQTGPHTAGWMSTWWWCKHTQTQALKHTMRFGWQRDSSHLLECDTLLRFTTIRGSRSQLVSSSSHHCYHHGNEPRLLLLSVTFSISLSRVYNCNVEICRFFRSCIDQWMEVAEVQMLTGSAKFKRFIHKLMIQKLQSHFLQTFQRLRVSCTNCWLVILPLGLRVLCCTSDQNKVVPCRLWNKDLQEGPSTIWLVNRVCSPVN